MTEAKGRLEIVAVPAGGWCEPDTGVCHIDSTDETARTETVDEGADTTDPPGAAP